MRDDNARLASIIRTLEEGGGHHLVEADEQTEIVGWLKELHERRMKADADAEASAMKTFTGTTFSLTEEEAKRVWDSLKAGKQIAYAPGPCRRCKGTGLAEIFVRSGCFGPETRHERCFSCQGTGTDKHRIAVPEV
jgi:DnaJ-class molecular chaperone